MKLLLGQHKTNNDSLENNHLEAMHLWGSWYFTWSSTWAGAEYY